MKTNKTPALLYLGGKYLLSEWILSFFPYHKLYVEPFSGAASILFEKPPSSQEIINDMNGEIVNFFCVMRDNPDELYKRLLLTPFSREEYDHSYEECSSDPIEQARKTAVKSWFGIGSNSVCQKSGFRNYAKDYTFTPNSYKGFLDNVYSLSYRLRSVIIENLPALELIDKNDREDTLFYLDPPYLHTTRTSNKRYSFEMSEKEHETLLSRVIASKGKFIISGYDCDLYNDYLGKSAYIKKEKSSRTFLQEERTEVLWISPNSIEQDLFGMAL